MGEYGITTELQECFFQAGIPENQRDFVRLLWFEDDDIKDGKIEIWHFKVHMWAVILSLFTVTRAICQVTADNRTKASQMTISTVLNGICLLMIC